MERRVVITGMGIWSCLGTDLETVKNSLYNGKSGIGIQPERLTYGYRSALTGIVEEPIITKKMLDRHTRAGMSEEAKYAYMSSLQAFSELDEQFERLPDGHEAKRSYYLGFRQAQSEARPNIVISLLKLN